MQRDVLKTGYLIRSNSQGGKTEITEKLSSVSDLTELDGIRVAYLGKKGSITALLKGMKDLSVEEKKTFGAEVNALKEEIETIYNKLGLQFDELKTNNKIKCISKRR